MRRLLDVAYIAILTGVLLELSVRWWGYSERYIHDPIYMSFPPSQDIPYVHKPNLVKARARGGAVLDTDAWGLRSRSSGTAAPKKEGEYRIAVIGDSVTFGEGVARTEDTFAARLEDLLNTQQSAAKVRVFNYGVSAYSVKEMAATLQYRVGASQPDLVLMAIIPEDLGLARTPGIDREGYFVDKRFSSSIGPDSIVRRLLRRLHLAYVIRNIVSTNNQSGLRAVEELDGGKTPEGYAYVQRLKTLADANHWPYAIVLLPVASSRFLSMPDRLRRDHIDYLDLSSLRREFTLEQFRAGRFDGHPSKLVHHRIAEILAGFVMKCELGRPASAQR